MTAETVGLGTSFLTYFGYALLVAFGYVRDFFSKTFGGGSLAAAPKGYADLVNDFEYFFVRRLFARIRDCWDRPISSKPGSHITVAGCKCSPAKIMMFRHNDMQHLEQVVREAVAMGQPRTRRPWTMILLVVEGIYSMEGEICNLPEIIRIKNKYGCYVYMDEAHSVGALGGRGRGICDHWGVDPKECDLLMGTFTKSFGSVGGYVAGSKELVDHVRASSYAMYYDASLPPGCCEQALRALMVMMGQDGTDTGLQKIGQLKRNANYFRKRLDEEGFTLLGDYESPVIPLMLYLPAMIAAFSRECLTEGIATVVVGFPATPLLLARSRFCISAGHTIEDLEEAVTKISQVGDRLGLKYL